MDDVGEAVRGEVRAAGHLRVSHGLYRPEPVPGDPVDPRVRDLAAWRLVLPPDAVFTHVTAGWLAGWWLPMLPDFVPVFAATALTSGRPRRPGLICSRLTEHETPPGWLVQGLPLDRPEEVLLRAARDLALLDLVPLVDSALRLGHTSMADLTDLCTGHRPGVRRLRAATTLADARSESWWETALRLFHVAVEIPVEPQVEVFDETGSFVARADLLISGTRFLQEYDGAEHRTAAGQGRDLLRDRRLAGAAYVRRGYTATDLVQRPSSVLREIDAALGRPFRPKRVRLWRRWVEESTLTAVGRRRLRNRWLHTTGPADWSRTA